MELLTGEYRNTLDEKGRILFPTKLRNELFKKDDSGGNSDEESEKNVVIITQAIDRCLWIYTLREWKSLSAKIMGAASPFNAKNNLVLRHFIGPAQEVELDRSGRISIPQSLRAYANLSKDCVLLGINKYIELWDAEEYSKYLAANEQSLADAADALSNISF